MLIKTVKRPENKRYLGDESTMLVHKLEKENNACDIEEIIAKENAVVFSPDKLNEAHRQGYNNCEYCLGKRVFRLGMRLEQ